MSIIMNDPKYGVRVELVEGDKFDVVFEGQRVAVDGVKKGLDLAVLFRHLIERYEDKGEND